MIPNYRVLLRPALALLSDGQLRRARDGREAMADEFQLTDDERQEVLSSGRHSTLDNRVGWTLTT